MIENCTAVILAGGESKRMGQDKASLRFGHDSLVNRAIRHMQPLFDTVVISVREPREHLSVPQLCDGGGDRGPMAGVATALEHVDSQWVFALACDMPFVSPEMVVAMADKRANQDVVVPCVDQVIQPLAAFYSKSCLSVMQAQMDEGRRSLRALIAKVNASIVSEQELRSFDPELLSFMDLDTRADVIRAEQRLALSKAKEGKVV